MRSRYLFFSFAAIWLLLITFLSLTGSPPHIKVAVLGWDKLQHATAYGILTGLLTRGLLKDRQQLLGTLIISVIIASSIGAVMEILQGLQHNGRQADPLDALANVFGSGVAGLLYWYGHTRTMKLLGMAMIWFAGLFFLLPAAARATEQPQIITDAGNFFAALPPAVSAMASFPAKTDAGGQWWTLTALGALGASYAYDEEIRGHLQGSRSPTLDHAADAGSFIGSPLLHVGLVAGIYTGGYLVDRDDWRHLAISAGAALLLADSITLVAKEAIGRARPDNGGDKNCFHAFRFNGRDDSLPSGHTASSFALATVLAGETDNNYLATAYYLGATWVGVSRMIQDHHWASDVVLGAAVGGLSGWSVRQSAAKKDNIAMTLIPLALPHGAGAAVVGQWR
jgi:membrane-associated phospholipid phosphatase